MTDTPAWRLALFALALAALWWWRGGEARRRAAAPQQPTGTTPQPQQTRGPQPRLWPGELDDYEARAGCARHVHAARASVLDFEAAAAKTYEADAGADGPKRVRALFLHRDRALKELREVRMRLPNDLTDEKRLARLTETLDASMLAAIEDARQRCGAPGVHPGPVDDAWYGAWYRAPNDVVR